MTGTGACAGIRLALGVYVLGAADPAERTLVRMHLAWCRACREDLAALAGLPGLLGRVPADQAEILLAGEAERDSPADSLPSGALPQLLGRIARARRARRWRAAGALAAAVAIAAGGSAVAQHAGGPARRAPARSIAWTTVSARNDLTLADATVRYAAVGWGTELEVRISGIAAGTGCTLRVTGAGRQARTAGGWTILAGQPGPWYPASTSLAASSVLGFSVVAGGRTLVTVPAGASARPGPGPRAR